MEFAVFYTNGFNRTTRYWDLEAQSDLFSLKVARAHALDLIKAGNHHVDIRGATEPGGELITMARCSRTQSGGSNWDHALEKPYARYLK